MSTVGRNDLCPCGSGKKYKRCCLPRDEAKAQAEAFVRPRPAPAPVEAPFAAELRPDVDRAVQRLLVRLERGERENLETNFNDLLQRYPDYHMTNYAMGVYVGLAHNDPAGAIPFFEKAVRVFPPLAEAHYNLGSACVKAVRLDAALVAFRNAIRYSDGADGIDEMARERLRELEQIIRDTSPFLTLEAFVENQKLFDRAFESLKAQRYEQAVELFKKVLEQQPEHVQSYGNMALALAGLGHKAAALASLDKALALDPGYEPARQNRNVIANMNEGEPFIPPFFAQTEYYREKLEAEKSGARPWWHKPQFWKTD